MTRLVLALAFTLQASTPGFDMNAWDRLGEANWRVVDGIVEADKGAGFLVSKTPYGDFRMTADFWVSNDANSGVFIRASNPKEISATNSYEVNIFDTRPDQTYRTGAIVNIARPQNMTMMTGGKWNTLEIVAKGPKMTVAINGTPMVDVEHRQFQRGPIALQASAGTVRFRNVQITPLN